MPEYEDKRLRVFLQILFEPIVQWFRDIPICPRIRGTIVILVYHNQMRIHIASVLKEMSLLEHEKDHDTEIMLSLDEFRVQIKKYRKETNARLDKLIRNGEIDSFTATSILNDRTFTRDAVKGLLDVGKILFSTHDIELKNVEEMISLSDKEIDAVANAGN